MDYYYNSDSFDITYLLDQYSGKNLEDIFQDHSIHKNELGTFMEFTWNIDKLDYKLNLAASKRKLLSNLKTVYYVGEKIERTLQRKGVKSLYDLRIHSRYHKSASEILSLII